MSSNYSISTNDLYCHHSCSLATPGTTHFVPTHQPLADNPKVMPTLFYRLFIFAVPFEIS